MGDVIFRRLAELAGAADRFAVSSRGTGDWHVGDGADHRAVTALHRAGFDGTSHRAAQLSGADITDIDLFVALAREHRDAIIARGADPERIVLLTSFDPERPSDPDVFDPYFSDQDAFDEVRAQVERACAALLAELINDPHILVPQVSA